MLHGIIVAFEEILTEMGSEVVHAPLRLALEVVQFALLAGVVWVVAVGFGQRRGFVANMLTDRETKVNERLQVASHAAENLTHAKQVAALKTRTANSEARRILADAKLEADEIETQARNEAEAEAKRITDRAEAALSTELAEMHLEIREALVDLVAGATRSIINEKMSVAEQRALIEGAIMDGVAKSHAGTASAKGARAKAPVAGNA